MGGHKKKGSTFDPRIPTPKADYNVTGEIFPDAKCNYFKAGKYNGKSYYRRSDGEFFIWWDGSFEWVLSRWLGSYEGYFWWHEDPNILGEYFAEVPSVGTAIVSAGPH